MLNCDMLLIDGTVLSEKATYKLRGAFLSKSWEPDFLTQL